MNFILRLLPHTHKKKEAAAITATAPFKNEKKIFASQSPFGAGS